MCVQGIQGGKRTLLKKLLAETSMEGRRFERDSEGEGSKSLPPDEISHLALDIGGEFPSPSPFCFGLASLQSLWILPMRLILVLDHFCRIRFRCGVESGGWLDFSNFQFLKFLYR